MGQNLGSKFANDLVEVSDIGGRRSENVVTEVAVEKEPESITCSETVSNHGKRLCPEIRADDDMVIRLHVEIRFTSIPNCREVHADRRFAIGSDLSDQVHARGNRDWSEATGRRDQTAQGQATSSGQSEDARAIDFAADVHVALSGRLDEDSVLGSNHHIELTVSASEALVVDLNHSGGIGP